MDADALKLDLAAAGYTRERCSTLVASIDESAASQQRMQAEVQALHHAGVTWQEGEFEQVLLDCAASDAVPRISSLPVCDSVKDLLRRELATPRRGAGWYGFAAACKMCSLRRFPAGPLDWEISGLPKSWIPKFPVRDWPRLAGFLAFKLHGFAPCAFLHVAGRPRNRGLILRAEVLKSFWRIAASIQLQPEIKGILAEAWFHDPAAVQANPHLRFLNEPYAEGGFISNIGEASRDAGFLEHNPERQQLYEKGELRYLRGVAIWPRAAAIRWMERHPEFAG